MPLLSVILPVYNTEMYIKAALHSVLKQSFQDFEIIVIDDCSTDDTVKAIQSIVDRRIKLIVNPVNSGRAFCDNMGQRFAQGIFIAKMDADDICSTNRFEIQIAYLQKHNHINTVGSTMQNFGSSQYLNRYPATPELAKAFTLFTLPVGNPSVMFRSELFTSMGMSYNEQLRQTEDYDFFARYIHQLSIVNLEMPLINYRTYPVQTKGAILKDRDKVADEVRTSLLKSWGIVINDQESAMHNRLCKLSDVTDKFDLDAAERWLNKLLTHNAQHPWFDEKALAQVIGERWYEACYHSDKSGLGRLRKYRSSNLYNLYKPGFNKEAKFFIKTIKSGFN